MCSLLPFHNVKLLHLLFIVDKFDDVKPTTDSRAG